MLNVNLRLENNNLVQQQLKEKNVFAPGMPHALIIETGAVCTLKCPFCPQNQDDFNLSRDFLKFSDFKKIVDYFEVFVDTILLFNWGEPLLNPDLSDMIMYAAKKEIRTIVHSNLNFLTAQMAETLIKAGLSELTASIDGASEESYQFYRRGGSLKVALENLKTLINKKKTLKMETPYIAWKFLVFRQNEHEINKAKEIANEIGVSINFAFAVAPGEFEPSLEEYNNKNFTDKFIKYYGLPCDQLWKAPVIHSDGTIFPCCMISQMKYSMGNFFQGDFREIWNSGKYRSLREIVTHKTPSDSSSYCTFCIFGQQKQSFK
jgi:radical SAM protein with 4Fe4S-binding SPASM domain